MTKIEIYDYDAKRISEMAGAFKTTYADIVEALVNMLDSEANLLDKASEDLLEEYL
jgi:hypothetical protein